jgi:hypothetical protein
LAARPTDLKAQSLRGFGRVDDGDGDVRLDIRQPAKGHEFVGVRIIGLPSGVCPICRVELPICPAIGVGASIKLDSATQFSYKMPI